MKLRRLLNKLPPGELEWDAADRYFFAALVVCFIGLVALVTIGVIYSF